MRRSLRGDEGAVATLVVVLLAVGVLTGMAALTVDVGQLHSERRELQNGADAAALAVAKDCAGGAVCDSSTSGISSQYADANALKDSAANVDYVCGNGDAALGACPASGPALAQCPALPTGITSYVQVGTSTREAGGGTLLPPTFARTLLGNDSYSGTTVAACARAAWGPPASLRSTLPVTISMCEWDFYTGNGTDYAPPPPYESGYPANYERTLHLHTPKKPVACPSSGGAWADLPGGFGWLEPVPGTCSALVDEDGQRAGADPGASMTQVCRDLIDDLVGTTTYLPIFDEEEVTGSGSTGTYHIVQFAAFYLTGYNFPGESEPSIANSKDEEGREDGGRHCKGEEFCLYGWFTTGIPPSGGGIGSGPFMGVNVVELVS